MEFDRLIKRGYSDFIPFDSGGQANLYKTFKDGRTYAIKVSKVKSTNESHALDKNQRLELQIIDSLRHPNCIRVREMFRTKDRLYIVMDFMPNGNVNTVVQKVGPLCEWNCRCWFPPIARAVMYLHQHKVAHRLVCL